MFTIYPDSIKNDILIQNQIKKNSVDISRYVNKNELAENYVCVFENTGQDVPDLALGLRYKLSKDYWKRKYECEHKFKPPAEPANYLSRDDWINPKESNFECGVFNMDNKRLMYDDNLPMKITSRRICNLYNKPRVLKHNQGKKNADNKIVYTKYVPKTNKRPAINLRKSKEKNDIYLNDVKSNLFIIFISLACIFYIIWIVKFNTLRPYTFYEYLYKSNFKRIIVLLLIFGIVIYIYCPFKTCYNPPLSSPFIITPFKELHKNYCEMINFGKGNNIANFFKNKYDENFLYHYLRFPINFLNKFTYNNKNFINNIYATSCIGCKMKFNCIDRHGTHDIRIKKIKPIIYNDIEELNKFRKNAFNWDDVALVKNNIIKRRGRIIKNEKNVYHLYLRTHWAYNSKTKKNELNNNSNWVQIKFLKKEKNAKDEDVWNMKNFSIKSDINELNMKYCGKTFKILGINENYNLLGYNKIVKLQYIDNREWQKSMFLNKVLNDDEDIYEYMPDFKFPDKLNSAGVRDALKPYEVRKVIDYYFRLNQDPSYRYCTKNYIYNKKLKKLIKYEFNDVKIINYLKKCNEYINKLSKINDYWNDDEKDDDYLHYTDQFKKLNNELRIKYRETETIKLLTEYNEYRNKNIKIVNSMYKNNKENIVNMHIYVPINTTSENNIFKCIICKQICKT